MQVVSHLDEEHLSAESFLQRGIGVWLAICDSAGERKREAEGVATEMGMDSTVAPEKNDPSG